MSKKQDKKPNAQPLIFKNTDHEQLHILQPVHFDVIVFSTDNSTFRLESEYGVPRCLEGQKFLSDGSTPEEIVEKIRNHNENVSNAKQSRRIGEYSEALTMFQDEVLSPIKELLETYKKPNENV